MNQQQFVDALRVHAADAAVEGTLAQCVSPSGRFASKERQAQSVWFNALSQQDRQMVETLLHETARATLFGMLCILDGSRAIEPPGTAHLRLARIEDGRTTVLGSTDLTTGPLHELV